MFLFDIFGFVWCDLLVFNKLICCLWGGFMCFFFVGMEFIMICFVVIGINWIIVCFVDVVYESGKMKLVVVYLCKVE